jgi:ABC-type transporter Mla subunit MlaD
LAQRNAEAARNTSVLIESSQESSKRGALVAAEVSENLKKIEESVGHVSTLVVEIVAASQEQRVGIEEINSVMHDMDKVVAENASSSEQSASAAKELSEQAAEMSNIVHRLAAMISEKGNVGSNQDYDVYEDEYNSDYVHESNQFYEKSYKVESNNYRPIEKDQSKNGNRKKNHRAELIPLDDHLSDF